jgi:hypothetical protein
MADTQCPMFQQYESGQVDQSPGCRFSPAKMVLWGGELVCRTVDPAGTSLCKTIDLGPTMGSVSPAAVLVSLAGWWLVWSLVVRRRG